MNKFQQKAQQKLSVEQYNICFLKGTEPAGSGKYYEHYEKGIYTCAVCKQQLFSSAGKFKSNSGWPSFFEPLEKEKILFKKDTTKGMERTEISCAKCNSHLGHVFDDGPEPTGKRFCVNSLSLDFIADE